MFVTTSFRFLGKACGPLLRVLWRVFGNRKNLGPAIYGERPRSVGPNAAESVSDVLACLDERADAWRRLPRRDKAALFRECIGSICQHGETLARVSTRAKGSYGSGNGEEYVALIPIVTYLDEVAECFDRLDSSGECTPMYATTSRRCADAPGEEQEVVDVFPVGLAGIALGGFRGELWICPGYKVTQGEQLRRNEEHTEPGVALVLGAGNQYPLVALDIFQMLVVQSRVVVCKMNPVNDYLGPFLREALAPLVREGFVEFVYGGAEVGSLLVHHPLIKSIHLTGSEATYDSIVWKGKDKTKEASPPLGKPVSAELGGVTPYIIIPGEWDEETIEYQAANVVSGMVNNAGHNCLAAEVLVTDASWPQREEFLNELRRQLDETSMRSAYYPGSAERFARFDNIFPNCEKYGRKASPPSGSDNENGSPFCWRLQTGLSPDACAVEEENWCGVLQEVCLRCDDSEDAFFRSAASFVNERCAGTLACAVLVDAWTQEAHHEALDTFIADLRYGSISVNVPCMVGFGVTRLSWGAFGADAEDRSRAIGSGNCHVHNTGLFDNVEKSVIYAPSVSYPPPYWFVTNKNLEETAKVALQFFRNKSVGSLAWLVVAAIQG